MTRTRLIHELCAAMRWEPAEDDGGPSHRSEPTGFADGRTSADPHASAKSCALLTGNAGG